MKRKTWKWIFGISLIVLFLLCVATVGIWILANIGGVLLLLLAMGSEDISVQGISFREFMSNFVGSPMFYLFMADLAVMVASIAGLILTGKQKNNAINP